MAYQKVYMNQIHSSSLLCQLSQMWRGEVLCDAFIRTGSVTTKAHRVVLVAACPMLQSMDGAAIGSQLEVKLSADIKKDSVTAFLQYLYEGFMMLTEDNVRDVEKISRLLQVDGVTKCCSDFHRNLKKTTGRSVVPDAQLRYTYADQAEFKHVRTSDLLRSMQNSEKRVSEADDLGRKRFRSSVAEDSVYGSYSQHSQQPSRRQRQVLEDSFELVQTELDTTPGSQGRPLPGRQPSTVGVTVASQVYSDPDVQIVSLPESADQGSKPAPGTSFSGFSSNKSASNFNFGGSLPSPSQKSSVQSIPSPRGTSVPRHVRSSTSSSLPSSSPSQKQESLQRDISISSPSAPSPSQVSKSGPPSVASEDGKGKDSEHPPELLSMLPISGETAQQSSSPPPDFSKATLEPVSGSSLADVSASLFGGKSAEDSKAALAITQASAEDTGDNSHQSTVPDLSIVKVEKVGEQPSTSDTGQSHRETGGLDMQVEMSGDMEDYGQIEDDVDEDSSEMEMWSYGDSGGKFVNDPSGAMYIQNIQDSGDGSGMYGMSPGGSGAGPGMSPMSRQGPGRGLQMDYANYVIMEPGKNIPAGYRLLAPGSIVAVPEMWYELTLSRCKGKSASYTLTAVTNGLIRPWEVRKGGTSAYDGTPLEPVIDALKLFGCHVTRLNRIRSKSVITKALCNMRRKLRPARLPMRRYAEEDNWSQALHTELPDRDWSEDRGEEAMFLVPRTVHVRMTESERTAAPDDLNFESDHEEVKTTSRTVKDESPR